MLTRLRKFTRKYWQFLVGTGIALLAIYLSYIFFVESIRSREPIFLIDPNRAEILSSERVSRAPIRVLKPDGSEIHSNLYVLRFYFWNRGNESIRRSNILEQLRVISTDSTIEIIEARVLAISRSLTKLQIIPDGSSPTKSFVLDFDILDTDDGATCQIIYQGTAQSDFTLSGAIEGVQSVQSRLGTPLGSLVMEIFKLVFTMIAVIVGIVLFFALLFWVSDFLEKQFLALLSNLFGKYGLKIGKAIVSLIGVAFLLLFAYALFSPLIKPRLEERVTEIHSVPEGIVPKR